MAATTRPSRLPMVGGPISVVLVLAVVACGPAGETTTTTTGPPMSTVPATTAGGATTPPDTTAPADTTTTTTTVMTLIEIADGAVDGSGVIEVNLGETVDVWVVSDIDDELHVHGYDLVFEVEAGVPLKLGFVADIPGVFEVEVHSTHGHVFDIRVVG